MNGIVVFIVVIYEGTIINVLRKMDNVVKSIKANNLTLNIFQDEYADSPRNWDNLGKMVCFHRRYNLGDKHDFNSDDFDGWDEFKKYLIQNEGAVVILPLYLYDHSGITMNTTGFSCGWDSGQVGFIYATREQILKEYGCKKITKKIKEKVENILKGEVKDFDQYITGDVYGFELLDENDETLDSCSGFFGYDFKENGLLEHVDCSEELREEFEKQI
jgi:hypothetical protein